MVNRQAPGLFALALIFWAGPLSASGQIPVLGTREIIEGHSANDVVITNHTGLTIARIQIGTRTYEGVAGQNNVNEKILISVTPVKHDMRLIFKGGADIKWLHFNFKGVHEIIFKRDQNKIDAHVL